MQSGQIGFPQSEQPTAVSILGWFAHGTGPLEISVPAALDTRPSVASADGRPVASRSPMTRGFSGLLRLAPEVEQALIRGQGVVALETSLVAHGLPQPDGVETALRSEHRVREAGAVPATVAMIDGAVRVGITEDELHMLAEAGPDGAQGRPARPCARRRLPRAGRDDGRRHTRSLPDRRHPLHGDRRDRRRAPRAGPARATSRPTSTSSRVGRRLRRLLGREVAARHPGHTRGARVVGVPADRLRHRQLPALLPPREPLPRPRPGRRRRRPSPRWRPTHWGFARTTGVVVAQPAAEEVALTAEDAGAADRGRAGRGGRRGRAPAWT